MLLHRMDVTECHTALEVKLLAALVRERRLRLMGVGIKPLRHSVPVETKPEPPSVPTPEIDPHDLVAAGNASVWQIQTATARRFSCTVHDLKAARRGNVICLARHVAVLLCHALTLYSYPCLGRYFARDHSTMVNSVEKMKWLEHELRSELTVNDSIGLWSARAHEKTVGKPVDNSKTTPESQPAVA